MENESTETRKKSEPRKTVNWIFDKDSSIIKVSDDCVKADNEKHFSFKLEKYKDRDTKEESLKITSLLDGVYNGFIVTSICNLDSDIKQFRKYGVVMESTYYRELYKKIEINYLAIPEIQVTLDTNDNRITDLIEQVRLYVAGDKDLITQDFCYVPVNMFNDLAYDCGYSSYEMKTLRSALAKKYLHVVSGRYAILTRIKDKPERVIAFYRERIEVELPVKKNSKKTETSGSDEK